MDNSILEEQRAYAKEQAEHCRDLFTAVVLAALHDAITENHKYGNGPAVIARWARSRDGREVLTCAGIDPNERAVDGLVRFVERGEYPSTALAQNTTNEEA